MPEVEGSRPRGLQPMKDATEGQTRPRRVEIPTREDESTAAGFTLAQISRPQLVWLCPTDASQKQIAFPAALRKHLAVRDPRLLGTDIYGMKVPTVGHIVGRVHAITNERQHDAFGRPQEPERLRIHLRHP